MLVAEGKSEDVFLRPGISLKKFLGDEEDDTLQSEGVNIKLFFPSKSSENALITRMARELNIDFSNIDKIGIMAGASTPKKSIDSIKEYLEKI